MLYYGLCPICRMNSRYEAIGSEDAFQYKYQCDICGEFIANLVVHNTFAEKTSFNQIRFILSGIIRWYNDIYKKENNNQQLFIDHQAAYSFVENGVEWMTIPSTIKEKEE